MGDLRIIAGEHGSRRIKVPASVARPTTDRVREALFSSLESLRGGLADARVLDAFAGSGALALEAMSRGAAFACLVERDGQAAKVAERNARSLGYDSARVRIMRADALSAPTIAAKLRRSAPFDMVFLDPPYATPSNGVFDVLDDLIIQDIVVENAIVTYEYATGAIQSGDLAECKSPFTDRKRPFTLLKTRSFGKTSVALLQAKQVRFY